MKSSNWLLLRGLGRNQGHWGAFPSLWRERFPQDQLDLMDLAGAGSEAHRPSLPSIGGALEDLRRRRGPGGPISILGLSMGAMIAAEWAHRYPSEVERLVLINTSSRSSSRFYERLKMMNYLRLARMAWRFRDRRYFEGQVLEMTMPQIPNPPEVLERHLSLPETPPLNWFTQLLAASQYQFPPEKPASEVLVLAAHGDQLVSSDCSKRIALQWKVPLVIHPQGCHDLPVAEARWVLDQVDSWRAAQG